MSVVAALLYFFIPIGLAIGVLFLLFRGLFKGMQHREQKEAESAEIRERLKEAFPDTQAIGNVMEAGPTGEEIDRSIEELKQDDK